MFGRTMSVISWTIYISALFITTTISLNVTSFDHFEAAFQGKCSAPNNPCVQLCTELFNNAFECHCHPGFILSIDGYSCLLSNSTEPIQHLPMQVEELQNYYYNGTDDSGGGNEQTYTNVDDVQLIDPTCISFSENSPIRILPILSNAYINDNIYIEFKPTKSDGLLLLTGESYDLLNDYIVIFLQDGYVVFRYDCGTGPGVIKSINQINLNEWNTLNIIRYKWNSWVQLNNYHYNHGKSQGLFSRITFRIPVFLGGANTSVSYPYYSGQIRKLLINKENYLSDTVSNCCNCLHGGICVNNECSCPFGYSGRSCEFFVDLQIPFFNETSYLKFKSILNGTTTYLNLQLVVKPLSHDGIILYSGRENSENEITDYICLLINQGYVEFYTDLGNGVGVTKSNVKLGLDTWHKISITISSRLINLDINGVSSSNHIPGAFNQLTLENNWYLGGIPNTDWLINNKINILNGFYGCIQQVLVNDGLINLMGSALIGINIENCQHECNSKPCGRNGFCVPDFANYKCTQQIETTSVNSIPKFTGNSYLKFTDPEILEKFEGKTLKLNIELKTSHTSGLVLYTSYNQHVNNDYLKIYLRDGYLNLAISLGSGYKFIKYPKLRLNDDHWHSISVTRNEQEIKLEVDQGETVVNYIPGKLSNFNIHDGVFIGGLEESDSAGTQVSDIGFIGCVKNLSVNDYVLSFEDTFLVPIASTKVPTW